MRDTKSALDNAEGLGQIWEEVFLETDKTLQTEDGTTATSVLVWKDSTNNICIQVSSQDKTTEKCVSLYSRSRFYS